MAEAMRDLRWVRIGLDGKFAPDSSSNANGSERVGTKARRALGPANSCIDITITMNEQQATYGITSLL
jgi:hypothetical protein